MLMCCIVYTSLLKAIAIAMQPLKTQLMHYLVWMHACSSTLLMALNDYCVCMALASAGILTFLKNG